MDRIKTIVALAVILFVLPAMVITGIALFAVASTREEPEPALWDDTLQTLPAEPVVLEPQPEPEPEPEPAPEAEPIEPEPEPEPSSEPEIITSECKRDPAAIRSRLRRAVGGRARICGIAVGNKTGDFSALLEKTFAIEFTVDVDGGVSDISLAGALGRDRELVECLEMAFSELRPGAHESSCRFLWRLPMRPDRLDDTLEMVEGSSLSRADVLAGVESNLRSLVRCLKRARRRGDLEPGHYILRLDWTIRPDGSVEGGRLVGPDQFLESSLPACVAGAMQKWKFPKGLTAVPVRNFTIGPLNVR
jgi:hypothetical protein